MIEIKDRYFKVPHDGPTLMSGLPLPDPKAGRYLFINCEFHIGLEQEMKENYGNAIFKDCWVPWL